MSDELLIDAHRIALAILTLATKHDFPKIAAHYRELAGLYEAEAKERGLL